MVALKISTSNWSSFNSFFSRLFIILSLFKLLEIKIGIPNQDGLTYLFSLIILKKLLIFFQIS